MLGYTTPPQDRGFTLAEMMTVLAIVATLIAIGVPSYRSITTSARVSSEVNGLLGDMQYARSEALKNGESVSICASTDSMTCSGDKDWKTGWIVFLNFDGDDTVDGGDTLLRVQRRLTGPDTLSATDDLSMLTFNRSGFALGMPGGGSLFTIHDSKSNSFYTRCLSITMAGMLQTQRHSDAPDTCL